MIAPEYFNNNIAVEGYVIVKNVPNEQGTVMVWNPSTKKLATRTNAEIISDMSLMTTNTIQYLNPTGTKNFYTEGGTNYYHNSIWIRGNGEGSAITFVDNGIGQFRFSNNKFYFTGSGGNNLIPIHAGSFIKEGGNGNNLLKDDGSTIAISSLATTHYHDYLQSDSLYLNTDLNNEGEPRKFKFRPAVLDSTPNMFPTINNANGILSISTWDYNVYEHQLGFSSNGNIYHRYKDFSGFHNWSKVLTDFNTDLSEFVSSKIINGSYNANNLSTNSITYGYSVANAPTTAISHSFTTLNLDTADQNFKMQIGFDGDTNEMFSRTKFAGNWNDWVKYATTSQLSNYATLNGVQTFSNTISFSQSPVIPNATLGSHAINLNQLTQSLGGYFPIRPIVAGTDANNEITSGLRTDYIWSNTPVSTIGTLLVESYSNDWIAQTFTVLGAGVAGQVWKRIRHSGTTWTNWVMIHTTQNFNPDSKVDAGDTTTKVLGFTAGNSSLAPYIYTNSGEFVYLATQTWTNELVQNVVKLNQPFSINGSQVALTDDYVDSEVGLTDISNDVLIAGKRGNLYQFGTPIGASFGMGVYMNPSTGNIGYSSTPSADISHKHYFNGNVVTNSGFSILGGTENQLFTADGGITEMDWEIINEAGSIRYKPYSRRFTGTYNTFGTDNRDVRLLLQDGGDVIMEQLYENQRITIMNVSGYDAFFQIDNTSVNVLIPPRSSAEFMVVNMEVVQLSLNTDNTIVVS